MKAKTCARLIPAVPLYEEPNWEFSGEIVIFDHGGLIAFFTARHASSERIFAMASENGGYRVIRKDLFFLARPTKFGCLPIAVGSARAGDILVLAGPGTFSENASVVIEVFRSLEDAEVHGLFEFDETKELDRLAA